MTTRDDHQPDLRDSDTYGLDPAQEFEPRDAPAVGYDPGVAHELAASPTEYIRTLGSGFACIKWGILLSLLLGFILPFALQFAVQSGVPTSTSVPQMHPAMEVFIAVLASAASILAAVGWYRVTEADPSLPDVLGRAGQRTALRVMMVISLIASFIGLVLNIVQAMSGAPAPTPSSSVSLSMVVVFTGISGLLGVAIYFGQIWVGFSYFRWLMERAGYAPAVERARKSPLRITLLSTVGIVLCGLGPLIAIVVYYNALDLFQKVLKGTARASAAIDAA